MTENAPDSLPHPSRDHHPTLPEMLASGARRMPDGWLVACAAAGVIALAALTTLRPGWWVLLVPLVGLGAFGAWGIADREATGRQGGPDPSPRLLTVLSTVKWTAVVVGTAAALLTGIGLMGVALGRLIS